MSDKNRSTLKLWDAVKFLKTYHIHVRRAAQGTGRTWCLDLVCKPFKQGAPGSALPESILRADPCEDGVSFNAWLCDEMVGVYHADAMGTLSCAPGKEFMRKSWAYQVFMSTEQVKALAEKIEMLITFS